MTARKRKRRLRATSIEPRRALVERLSRELERSKVRPEAIAQAAVAFNIILRAARR
jgi:hypothetical protein